MFKQFLSVLLGIGFLTQLAAQPTVVASGFAPGQLIGVDVDASGNIWVTESGTGNDDGKVTYITPSGEKVLFMQGLPSALNPATGEIAGPTRVYQLPNNLVFVIVGEGPHAQAEAFLVVSKATFTPGTPLTLANVLQTIKIGDFVHGQGFLQSNPYNVSFQANGDIYIADAGANSILKRDFATGALSTVATLSPIPNPLPFGPPMADPVPTDILPKPGGGFYVSQLTGFPFLQGVANVFSLDATTGTLTPAFSGLTCLTDLGYDPKDGNLCVSQFGVFGPVDSTLNFILGTAAVIKLLPDGSHDTIAIGIGGLSPSFTFDAAGDLYVTDLVFGQVLKYDLTSGTSDLGALKTQVLAFPNPFAEQVQITYTLEHAATVQADIYDLQGRVVRSFGKSQQAAGQQTLVWDAIQQPAGTYVYRLIVDGHLSSGLLNVVR